MYGVRYGHNGHHFLAALPETVKRNDLAAVEAWAHMAFSHGNLDYVALVDKCAYHVAMASKEGRCDAALHTHEILGYVSHGGEHYRILRPAPVSYERERG